MTGDTLFVSYTRAVAILTMAFYTAGHAAVGFPLFVAGAVWRLVSRRPPLWHRTPLDLPLAAFGVILVLSTLTSAHRSMAVEATLITVISGGILFGSFAWLVGRDPSARAMLMRVWALSAPPAVPIGIIAGRIAHTRAFFPEMPMAANGFGTTLFLGSLVALGLAYRTRGRGQLLWLACLMVSVIGLVAAQSRSAMAGWLAGAVYLTWRELRPHPVRLAGALATGIAVLVLAASIAPSVASRVKDVPDDLVQVRLPIWRTAVAIFQTHTWLGTGPGTFHVMFDQQKPASLRSMSSAHNLWLHYAVETGVLGLLSIGWIIYVIVREWVRAGRLVPPESDPLRPTLTALGIGLLINQCGDNTLLSVSTISGCLLLIAMLVVPAPPSVRSPAA